MKKFLLALFICLPFIFGCSQKTYDPAVYGTSMVKEYSKMFSVAQFDSICIADTISNELKEWHRLQFLNAETYTPEVQFTYIKRLGKNQSIYVVELSQQSDSLYITKRTTK